MSGASQLVNLMVIKNGNGAGTVTSSPGGINCGSDCIAVYAPGTTVTLTAIPDAGNTFAGWTGGGCTGTDPCIVTVTADTSIEAAFAKEQFTVTVTPNGNGTGKVTSTPTGIDCGNTCNAKFDVGTQVMLQPAPGVGSTFVGWTGGGCTGTGPCSVTVSADTTVQASFALYNSIVVTRTGNGTGTVTSNDGSISCGTNCSYQYSPNSMVTLTATAGAHSNFAGWSGGGCSGSGPCIVTVSAATAVTATFTLQTFALTTTLAGNGGGVVKSIDNKINCGANCSFMYDYGTIVTLNATANTGSTFSGWSGGGCSGSGPCIVTVSAATAVTATFTLQKFALTTTLAGNGGGVVKSVDNNINCGVNCSFMYGYGTVVTLNATVNTGSFSGWSGRDCSGTGACVVTITAATAVTATFTLAGGSIPFKTLQAATNADGTIFVGGGGFTVTHPRTGNYHVTFLPGTWNNGGMACFYVPEVQSIFTASPAEITGWTTFSDGSGSVDIVVVSGADAPLMLDFTSANC